MVIDRDIIPTGEIIPVEKTPQDLRTETEIGDNISQDHLQLIFNRGFGHYWVLNKPGPGKLTHAASLRNEVSPFKLQIFTTEPGLQFNTAQHFQGTVRGKSGRVYDSLGGVTLEPERFPDSPYHDNFPSIILIPGENYYQKTVMEFGFVEK